MRKNMWVKFNGINEVQANFLMKKSVHMEKYETENIGSGN